jgi:hypothetical protein
LENCDSDYRRKSEQICQRKIFLAGYRRSQEDQNSKTGGSEPKDRYTQGSEQTAKLEAECQGDP